MGGAIGRRGSVGMNPVLLEVDVKPASSANIPPLRLDAAVCIEPLAIWIGAVE